MTEIKDISKIITKTSEKLPNHNNSRVNNSSQMIDELNLSLTSLETNFADVNDTNENTGITKINTELSIADIDIEKIRECVDKSLDAGEYSYDIECNNFSEAKNILDLLIKSDFSDDELFQIRFYLKDSSDFMFAKKVWRQAIRELDYVEEIDGITFSSETAEGLQSLVDFYNNLKQDCSDINKNFLEQLEGLAITNYKFSYEDNTAYQNKEVIFLPDNKEVNNIFYHEAAHYLDYKYNYEVSKKYYIEACKNVEYDLTTFRDDYSKIKNRASNISLIDTIKIIKKIYSEVPDFKSLPLSDKIDIYKEYEFRQYDEYMRSTCINSISDIFDALTFGVLGEQGYYGHGTTYYSDPDNRGEEVLAQVSAIYNSGKTDLLYKYFNKEFVDTIIAGYEVVAGIKKDNMED